MTDQCGSNAGYQRHYTNRESPCRACKDAHNRTKKDYRKRLYLARGPVHIPADGTRRRLQALVVMGWPLADLGDRLGVHLANLSRWIRADNVARSTAARVAALYDELWDQPGPSEKGAKRAKTRGWLPPLAWDDDTIDDPAARPSRMTEKRPAFDEIAVQRAMRGSEVHLRPVERAEVVRRLTDLRLSTVEIAERLRVTERSVTRHRSAMNSAEKAS